MVLGRAFPSPNLWIPFNLLRQVTVQEGHNLSPGAGGAGGEGRVTGALSDSLLHSPSHSLAVLRYVRKGSPARNRRAACQLPQVSDGSQPSSGRVRTKPVGQTPLQRPVRGIRVILSARNRGITFCRSRRTLGPPQEGQEICAVVQVLSGENVVALVPAVIPFSTAHCTGAA